MCTVGCRITSIVDGEKEVSAMATKNTVEVVIAGKVFRISGYETPEYLHQVSVYINEKLAQFQQMDGYRKQNTDQKQMMLNMNLADDFFKAKHQADKLSAELEKKEREMYGIRHDLIEAQMANEKLESEMKELKESQIAQKKEWETKLASEKKELTAKLNAEKKELEESLEAQKKELESRKQESAEKLESRKQEADRERQELKRTIAAQERNLENQKKAMEAQRQSSHKKLEDQNQAAQKRLTEQKRSFEAEIERLQRENRELQRRLGQRSYT